MNRATTVDQHHTVSRPSIPAWSAAAAIVALFTGPAWATEDATLRDCVLTTRARQALMQDSALAPLNLGVSVRSSVATIWGELPSAALKRRAEEKIRKVSGIGEVRNELLVEAVDPATELLRSATAAAQRPTFESLLNPEIRSSAHLTSHWAECSASPSPPLRPAGTMPPIVLLAPVGDLAAPVRSESGLSSAIAEMQQTDPRFAGLRADVDGGLVRLSGVVAHGGDAMEFARNLSHIPGVERVVIGAIRSGVNTLPGRQ